jgi:hypothetical protein
MHSRLSPLGSNELVSNRKELIGRYLRGAWVLKIRLMSARRQLWDHQTSVIHIENAVLQMRKSCEAICYLCLVAAEIDLVEVSKALYGDYRVGATLKKLPGKGVDHFPRFSRLSQKAANEENSGWELDRHDLDPTDIDRVIAISNQCGNLLHENNFYRNLGSLTKQDIWLNLNALRADNQWLWNRFWHHSVVLQHGWFFISLGDMASASQPMMIREEGFLQEELELGFDPDLIADWTGIVDWPELAG